MKRIVRPWKPLTCCIATLCQLAVPLSVTTVLSPQYASADTANAVPVIEEPRLHGDDTPETFVAKIPVGKTLLVPIAASDADGDPLTYTVRSSDPSRVLVRARTGRPHLKLDVAYAGDPGDPDDPADPNDTTYPPEPEFSGTLDFQLFRDWTPTTAGFIGGFAQSLFYSPRMEGTTQRHTIFHRVVKDFMVQGGDPNGQLPDPTTGNALDRGPRFSFENEFDIPLLFSGRGQLAMANAGSNGNYEASNGSQFFITTSSPRFLDIKHTIFGQLVRGWDLLEKMQKVPVKLQTSGTEKSRPTTDIKITGTSLVPNFTDALLVLSATGKTNSPVTITVEVSDGKGGTATKTFNASAVVDEFNTPPFFTKLPEPQIAPVGKITSFPVRAVDLEQDYFTYENAVLPRSFPRGESSKGGTPMLVRPYPSFPGPMILGFWLRQLEMRANSFGPDENSQPLSGVRDHRSIRVGTNDHDLRAEPVPITGTPGTSLTNVAVASYVDSNPRGQASDVSVSINWGDGSKTENDAARTSPSVGALVRDPNNPGTAAYRITGTHVYANKGVYPVVTTIKNDTTGLRQVVYSTAVITDGPLRVHGQKHTVKGPLFSGKPLALFSDTATGTTPADYEVLLNWGDGSVTPGEVKQTGSGQLYITGEHRYRDPETFSVAIRLHKKGTAPETAAHAWATLELTGFEPTEQHLPPFPMAHIVGIMDRVVDTEKQQYKPIRVTTGEGAKAQTTFTVQLSLLNNGNKKAKASKVRFYLSVDDKLNLTQETYNEGTEEAPVERVNPKDIPLTIGKKQKEISLIPLKPGMGGGLAFDGGTRLYAPPGEDGTGYHLMAAFVYDDPLAKQMPIDQEIAMELSPVITVPDATIEVSEYEGQIHTRPLKITFNRRPRNEVRIPLKMVNVNNTIDTSEAEFTDAAEGSKGEFTVVYTPAMWNAGTKTVEVKITGKADAPNAPVSSDGTAFVIFSPTQSDDPVFHGRNLSFVRVVNRDLQSFVVVDPVQLQTTEATGAGNTKTFKITLKEKPLANVTVPITVGDTTEGEVSGVVTNGQTNLPIVNGVPTLTFATSETYPANRVITVKGLDDNEADGNAQYTITLGPTNSAGDLRYHQLTLPSVSVTNVDNPPAPPANP